MMAFGECVDHIQKLGSESRKHDFAVAFWGRGAGRNLGLTEGTGAAKPKSDIRIICNLRLGGTCPEEIELLIAAGIAVKHDDRLHAKVYRFDHQAIVGSANASSNGLGFESSEAHWFEASYIVEAPDALRQTDEWFEERWKWAKPVSPEDLEIAKANYNRNRAKRASFLHSLLQGPVLNVFDELKNITSTTKVSAYQAIGRGRTRRRRVCAFIRPEEINRSQEE